MLTPGVTYGYAQAQQVLEQALAHRSKPLALNPPNIKIELQFVDPKLAQKALMSGWPSASATAGPTNARKGASARTRPCACAANWPG